jgi:hypothetical protein
VANEHSRQLLNYLLLCEQPRGKLINFRTQKVQAQFINTQLMNADRLRFRFCDVRWREICDRCRLGRVPNVRSCGEARRRLESKEFRRFLVVVLGRVQIFQVSWRLPVPVAAPVGGHRVAGVGQHFLPTAA